jgi:peptidoglycan/LPS O-acetylase OafA/YrhL
LIAGSFVKSRGVADYFTKRVSRIFPAFAVAGVVSLVVFAPLPMGFDRSYWSYVELPNFTIRLLTLRTLWVPPTYATNHWPYVNSAVWTIQYEFVCYVLVAIVGVAGLLRRRVLILALFAGALVGNALHHHFLPQLLERFPTNPLFTYAEWPFGGTPGYYPRFVTYFLAGTTFYLFRDRIPLTVSGALLAWGALFLALFIYQGYDLVMPVAGTYLAFWFAFNRAVPVQGFGRHGDFSYGLYLYGWPVQQGVIWLTAGRISPLVLFALSLPMALALAYASWHLVERHFLVARSASGSPNCGPVAVAGAS